jgi:hypothetical protein
MGTYRYDQICDELAHLRHEHECYDGSRSMGHVTPDMEKKADEISAKMRVLEAEMEGIDRGELPNPRI